MPLCEELNIPIVVDYHHDWIYVSFIAVLTNLGVSSPRLTSFLGYFHAPLNASALGAPCHGAHTYSQQNMEAQRDSGKATSV